MAGPEQPRVITGSNYVANILVSTEVPSLFVWDIPGVQPLTAFRTELQVIKADNQDGTTKVYLLAVERLSLKHRFIDLWENPLCRGNNPNALTSRGRHQGPERMRILFSTAEKAQYFYHQVEDVLLSYSASQEQIPTTSNDIVHYHPVRPSMSSKAPSSRTIQPPASPPIPDAMAAPEPPTQAALVLSDPSDQGREVVSPVVKAPASPPIPDAMAAPEPPTPQSPTSGLGLLQNDQDSPGASRPLHGTRCSVITGGNPNAQTESAIKDKLHLITTRISHLVDLVDTRHIQPEVHRPLEDALVSLAETVAALTKKVPLGCRTMQDATPVLIHAIQHTLSSLQFIVKKHVDSADSKVHDPQAQETSQDVLAQQTPHLKRRSPSVSSQPVSKRPRTSQRGSSAAITLLMLCASSRDDTTVRFGTVEWVADPHQLRVQVYIVGKAAWDSVSVLYSTLRSVYRDEKEPGYACLVFPTRSFATMFSEAWAAHRQQAEDWKDAQAWVV